MSTENTDRLKKQAENGDVMALIMLLREAQRGNNEELLAWGKEKAEKLIQALQHDVALLRAAAGLPAYDFTKMAEELIQKQNERINPYDRVNPTPDRYPHWIDPSGLWTYPGYDLHRDSAGTSDAITLTNGTSDASDHITLTNGTSVISSS